MRVIKEGKFKVPWTSTVACEKCDAELELEEVDVKPVDYGTGYRSECEVCGEWVPLKDEDIPLRIRSACDKKRKIYYCDD